jgi:hypothetical protein
MPPADCSVRGKRVMPCQTDGPLFFTTKLIRGLRRHRDGRKLSYCGPRWEKIFLTFAPTPIFMVGTKHTKTMSRWQGLHLIGLFFVCLMPLWWIIAVRRFDEGCGVGHAGPTAPKDTLRDANHVLTRAAEREVDGRPAPTMTMTGLYVDAVYAAVVLHRSGGRRRRASMASKAFLILAIYSFL